MTLRILSPGLLTTLQDLGRIGQRHLGVGSGGAADPYSLQIANLLVGNPAGSAALEITLSGPTLQFERPARIALCGGRIDARCNDVALPGWRPIELPAGAVLRLGAIGQGCRCYLAIAGGFAADATLGSVSTDLRGEFGGWQGRALRSGDVLPLRSAAITNGALRIARWWVDPRPALDFERPALLQIMPGCDLTDPADALLDSPWRVAAASNRQGLRLQGPALVAQSTRQRLSSPVLPGSVQLPPDGQPIVLLADAQTVGGYPLIAQLALADLPRAGQLRSGELVQFAACSTETAWQRHAAQRQSLARMAIAIENRLQHDGKL